MELRLAVEGNLREFLEGERLGGARAATSAVRRAGTGLKTEARRQVVAAGLDRNAAPGRSVSKTWQDKVYPARGVSLGAAALVFSKFPRAIRAFEAGAVIRARNGAKWLAVPSENVGRSGNRRLKPADYAGGLDFVPTRDPNVAMLVHHVPAARGGRGRPTVVFWLYKQVRITKRLDFFRAADKWGDRIPGYLVAEWSRREARAGFRPVLGGLQSVVG